LESRDQEKKGGVNRSLLRNRAMHTGFEKDREKGIIGAI